jgi:hypothetical protein
MKLKALSILLALSSATLSLSAADKVHQSVEAEESKTSGGEYAINVGVMETQEKEGATLARAVATAGQWSFVSYWIGIPAPAGKAIVRFRVYNTTEETAKYVMYIKTEESQKMIGELAVPADAPKSAFVDVDIPVEMDVEWSGIILKKAVADEVPSVWLDSISVILK